MSLFQFSVTGPMLPELRGFRGRDAQRLLKWLNLEMKYSGDVDGVVADQSIASGSRVVQKKIIGVTLASRNLKRKSP